MRFPGTLLLAVLGTGWLAGGNLIFDHSFNVSQVTTGEAVALDSQGNIYVAGMTASQANAGVASAFVNKLTPDGSQLIYTINFGGSGYTAVTGLAVDGAGSAYVAGYTSSPDFPVTSGAIQKSLAAPYNAFVTKLNPAGSQMVYSTLLGGAGPKLSYAEAFGIAVDSEGNAIITGQTQGTSFQVTPNAFQSAPVVAGCTQNLLYANAPTTGDPFVTKIAPDGASLVYSTLLGGTCSTFGLAVALDASGNAWVTGYTSSPDFPVTSGALQSQFAGVYDGYFARFSPDGSLAYASYLGGNGIGLVTGIAFDSSGDIFLSGTSIGSNPAAFGASLPNAGIQCVIPGEFGPEVLLFGGAPFVAKLSPNASSVSSSSYIDGACTGNPLVAVDPSGSPWIGGNLFGGDVLTSSVATVSPVQIGGTGFLAKFTSDLGQTLFSSDFDTINGLTLDSSGMAYISGAGPFTTTEAAFVAKIDATAPPISLNQVLPIGSVEINSDATLGWGVAPGEVLRLIGKGIGPAAVTPGIISSANVVANSVAGVEVTFGGVPAPLLSVSSTEIDVVAPFEIAAQNGLTTIQVQYNGAQANAVRMPVLQTAVEALAVLNPDGTLNSASNRAPAGSTIAVYLAGVGQTNPTSQDGQLNQAPFAQAGIQIQLGNAQVSYIGAAPGLVAGILQVNFMAAQSGQVTVQAPGSSTTFSTYFITPNP
jgi:uncharacterized protein (TIGR03437 family)